MNVDSFSTWAFSLLERSLFILEIVFSAVSVLCLAGCLIVLFVLYRKRDDNGDEVEQEERFSRQQVLSELRGRLSSASAAHHHGTVRGSSRSSIHSSSGATPASGGDYHRPRFVLPAIDEQFGEQLREYYVALSVLCLQPRASEDHIKAAYRGLVKKYHPDASGDPEDHLRTEKLQVATQAYHRLIGLAHDVEFQTKLSLLHRDGG